MSPAEETAPNRSDSAPAHRSGRHHEAERTVVRLTDAALGDLENMLKRGDPQVVRWALKKCILLERDPEAGEDLRGSLRGYRKLTVGNRDWRVVWRVTHDASGQIIVDVAEVWAVGARSDSEVYQEMKSRVDSFSDSPHTVSLAEAIDRLGKVAEGLDAVPEPDDGEAVPEWLVHVLTNVVRMPREKVDQLSPAQAQEVWDAYTNSPR